MRVKSVNIGARASDLARIQAYSVGDELKKKYPDLDIKYTFRSSWGDKNLDVNLSQMPEKGAFTQDFVSLLINGDCDLVVHSWKDLPTEERADTEVVATLQRASQNDVLLFKPDSVGKAGALKILTSSPRREYCLGPFLKDALPWSVTEVIFEPVRGNVPTRVQKLLNGDCDGLIVAKAALDRLLCAERSEFQVTAATLKSSLQQLRWMVLPLGECPTAPAQGALAIEIRKDRQDLRVLLDPLNVKDVFNDVCAERAVLQSYGGGCHARLGVSQITFPFGEVQWRKGFMNQTALQAENLKPASVYPTAMWSECWPKAPLQFTRKAIQVEPARFAERDLFVAKTEAWPSKISLSPAQVVWTSGWKSWQKLARQGVWVNGCSDSLGELLAPDVRALAGRALQWLKLTHNQTQAGSLWPEIATYNLELTGALDLTGKRCFFWPSPLVFAIAAQKYPEIVLSPQALHGVGPGKTLNYVKSQIPPERLRVYLSYEHWKNHFCGDN